MNESRVTKDGLVGGRPGRDAPTGVHVPPGGGGSRPRRRRNEPEFRTYYDLPVINRPVWEAPDIPGYLFLGGLAGSSAVVAAAAERSGRSGLARVGKLAAAGGGHLSLVALIHDLGRRGRFLNMLRVFKVTSPMSVGSWVLAAFVPAASVAAASDLLRRARLIGAAGTWGAAALGPVVSTYTATLISDTAVPAWHDGHRWMPFVFASSAVTSAAGLGLMAAPHEETGPLVPLAVAGGVAEVALTKAMEHSIGLPGEAYHEEKPKRYLRAAEVLTAAGAVVAAFGRRSRTCAVVGGAALFCGSIAERFGIFEAGLASADDPKYTVVPQRRRLENKRA
jgi:hypothetical protein